MKNQQTGVASPGHHGDLRSVLLLIERGIKFADVDIIYEALSLSELISEEPAVLNALQEYGLGSAETIRRQSDDECEYRMYDDNDIQEAHETIRKVAFGDATEALAALEYDLASFDPHIDREARSDIFQSKYFSQEDRIVWKQGRALLQRYHEDTSDINYQALVDFRDVLRSYLQRFYGKLVPTIAASYLSDSGKHGATVRFAWIDDTLQIRVQAEALAKALDEYFLDTDSPRIQGIVDFTPEVIPKQLANYHLVDVSSIVNLFLYELE